MHLANMISTSVDVQPDPPVQDEQEITITPSEVTETAAIFKEALAEYITEKRISQIDPLQSHAAAMGKTAGDLGLEDTSEVARIVYNVDGFDDEDDDLDEFSRTEGFTDEEVGLYTAVNAVKLSSEAAYAGITGHHNCLHALAARGDDLKQYQNILSQRGDIDQDLALSIENAFPGTLQTNTKMFTKRPSQVGYSLAREDLSNQQLALSAVAATGASILIYKIISWIGNSLAGNPAAMGSISGAAKDFATRSSRIKQDRRNVEEILKELNKDPEEMLKLLGEANTQDIGNKLKTGTMEDVLNAKWTAPGEYDKYVNGLLKIFVSEGVSKARSFSDNLTQVSKGVEEATGRLSGIVLNIANTNEGEAVNFEAISTEIDSSLAFVDGFINRNNISVPDGSSNVEKVNVVAEWLKDKLTPITDWRPEEQPDPEIFLALGVEPFEPFDDGFVKNLGKTRERITSIRSKEDATNKDTDNKNQAFKVTSDGFVALSGLIKAILAYRNWLGRLVTAEASFTKRVSGFFGFK